MEMFTNNNGKWKIENGKLFITMTFFVLCLVALKCYAFANFYLVATSDKDLQAKVEFLDKLSVCEKHKYQEIIPILQQFRDEGLKITVHMGENPNYQIFPFDEFRPDRVSHAYFFKDIHYHQFMKRKIPVEVCPTLSYKITHATDFSKIPMSNFYNKKIEDEEGKEFVYDLISINTDDVMLVLTDISQEYFEVASNFGMTIKDLKNIIIKTIDTIFEKDENVRNKLREKINNYPC